LFTRIIKTFVQRYSTPSGADILQRNTRITVISELRLQGYFLFSLG